METRASILESFESKLSSSIWAVLYSYWSSIWLLGEARIFRQVFLTFYWCSLKLPTLERRNRNFHLNCLIELTDMDMTSHVCDLCFASFSFQVCGRLKVEVSRISGTWFTKASKWAWIFVNKRVVVLRALVAWRFATYRRETIRE